MLDFLLDPIKLVLIQGIIDSLIDLFTAIGIVVSDSALDAARTPGEWNEDIFTVIQNISDAVILPIAGIVLTYVVVYDLLQMVMASNNFQNVEVSVILKWILKTTVAVLLLSNSFTITMAIFDLSQAVILGSVDSFGPMSINSAINMWDFRMSLEAMDLGQLFLLFAEVSIAHIVAWVLRVYIFVIVCGRMIQIYLTVSLAPIPFATLTNKEIGQVGQGYIKTICALAFQGFLIVVCLAIYTALAAGLLASPEQMANLPVAMLEFLGITALLCFTLSKTATLSNSIFGAH